MKRLMEAGRLRLGLLASGRGSNFDAIMAAIVRQDLNATMALVISDNREAAVLQKAALRNVRNCFVDPDKFTNKCEYEAYLVELLQAEGVNLVVLAGYMRLVGEVFLKAYKDRIVNIHPSLLPSFPGLNAQRRALEYGVKYSGCTVHLVDEGMDTGPIIMQSVVPVAQDDDEDSLATRILVQEHKLYWRCLQLIAEGRVWLEGRRVFIR
ncbi:MAG: phosphoribosylglycinamide formyltransferase [Syntrophomonadaceae bacterium]|jgi:phosphoribosylglycinamide formyltransferase-1